MFNLAVSQSVASNVALLKLLFLVLVTFSYVRQYVATSRVGAVISALLDKSSPTLVLKRCFGSCAGRHVDPD